VAEPEKMAWVEPENFLLTRAVAEPEKKCTVNYSCKNPLLKIIINNHMNNLKSFNNIYERNFI